MNPAELEPSLHTVFSERLIIAARRSRLGVGLCWGGWIHLAIFTICEWLFHQGDRAATHFLSLWLLDGVLLSLVIRSRMPVASGKDMGGSARLAIRVWLTFGILCFTSASLNSITGFQIDWFKISWSLLSTFAFAMMAWIFHVALLVLAIQMSLTALFIAAFPDHAYLIFGFSWFVALNALGVILERDRIIQVWIKLVLRPGEVRLERELP